MKFQFLGLCMYLCAHNHETSELLVNFRLETLALVLCSILSEECALQMQSDQAYLYFITRDIYIER